MKQQNIVHPNKLIEEYRKYIIAANQLLKKMHQWLDECKSSLFLKRKKRKKLGFNVAK